MLGSLKLLKHKMIEQSLLRIRLVILMQLTGLVIHTWYQSLMRLIRATLWQRCYLGQQLSDVVCYVVLMAMILFWKLLVFQEIVNLFRIIYSYSRLLKLVQVIKHVFVFLLIWPMLSFWDSLVLDLTLKSVQSIDILVVHQLQLETHLVQQVQLRVFVTETKFFLLLLV